MADDEANHSKSTDGPGFVPVSVCETPVSGSASQPQGEPKAAQADLPEAGLRGSRDKDSAPAPGPTGKQTKPPKPRSRFAALAATALVGGVLGGILGLGGTVVLRHFEGSKLRDVLTGQISALSTRVDAVEGKDATASAATRMALTALETRVAGAESAANKAAESAEEAQSSQADLETRVGATESTANKAADSAASAQAGLQKVTEAQDPTALAALETRVAAIESVANKAADSAASAQAGLQKITEAQPPGQDPATAAANRTALAALETRVAAAESVANKAADSAASAQAGLQKALESQPTAQESTAGSNLSGAAGLGPLNARIGAIEQKLSSLESSLAAAPKAGLQPQQQSHQGPAVTQNDPAQAIAIVAQSLLRKLESGEPFPGELTALENLGVPADSLAPLRAVATSADSNERELTAQFATLAPAIIASDPANQASGDESFLDRVARRAKSLVHIHRVGGAEDTDVESLVTRIENALADHELQAAYKLWMQLPSASMTKSEGWGGTVKARLDAINAARSIEADAVAVLGKSKS